MYWHAELALGVDARLKELVGLTVYLAEIPKDQPPPPIQVGGVPDPSGRVAPYAVQYPFGGAVNGQPDLGDCNVDLTWLTQVTVVAGYARDCLYWAGRIHAHLHRWAPALAGVVVGPLRPPPGFVAGPVQREDDLDQAPPRFYLPLEYQLTATT